MPAETPAQTKRRVRDVQIKKSFLKHMQPGVIRTAAILAVAKELGFPVSTINRITSNLNR